MPCNLRRSVATEPPSPPAYCLPSSHRYIISLLAEANSNVGILTSLLDDIKDFLKPFEQVGGGVFLISLDFDESRCYRILLLQLILLLLLLLLLLRCL